MLEWNSTSCSCIRVGSFCMRCALPYAVAWCKKRNETKWSGNKRNETKRTTCQLVLLQAECEWRESVFHLDARNSQRVPHLVHERLSLSRALSLSLSLTWCTNALMDTRICRSRAELCGAAALASAASSCASTFRVDVRVNSRAVVRWVGE